MTRVLISEFNTIVGLGIREVLKDGGCEVLTICRAFNRDKIADLEPDTLIVDMDDADVSSQAERIVAEFPRLALVECSSDSDRMRVFPSDGSGTSFDSTLSPELLLSAVIGA